MEKTHRGSSRQIEQLTEELDQLTLDVQDRQREMDDYKRFALREAFYVRFNAMYEYGQKMALLAGFGKYLVDLLDIEPTPPGQARTEYTKARDADRIWMDCLLAIDGWSAELDERPTVLERFLDDDDEEDAAPLSETDVTYGTEQYRQEVEEEAPSQRGMTQPEEATEVTEASAAEEETEEALRKSGLTSSNADVSGEWKYYAAVPEKQEPPAYSEIHPEHATTTYAAQDNPASSHDEKESLESYYELYKRYEQEEQTHPCRPYREFRRQTIKRDKR
ncbi:hypothetical protein BCR43DRAFT_492889 [Syncephalastrum racemosum]|uniref:Uncharacterized protein n=1 Tax=Syncephalastrum racemosum TaxID=13706 RepID=A0A1X2H9P8_SYNRA|nr:hypothetical protein BCR43DRAFT_492889 [Syncephalastrum racemosum]